jgi:hypothetical protein
MTYPVTENNEGYDSGVVKILFVPQGEDINTSKAQTPDKLQDQHSVHVAEIKRNHHTLIRLDDVKEKNT